MIGCWCLVVGVWLFCCLVVLLFGCLVVLLSVWKTVPSKARVTRDEVSGLKNKEGEAVWKTVPELYDY